MRRSRQQRGIPWELTEARFTKSTIPSASVSISTSTLLFHSSSTVSKYSAEVCSMTRGAAPCESRFAVGSFEGRDTSDWSISDISERLSTLGPHATYTLSHGQRQIGFECACVQLVVFISHHSSLPRLLIVAFVCFPGNHFSESASIPFPPCHIHISVHYRLRRQSHMASMPRADSLTVSDRHTDNSPRP